MKPKLEDRSGVPARAGQEARRDLYWKRFHDSNIVFAKTEAMNLFPPLPEEFRDLTASELNEFQRRRLRELTPKERLRLRMIRFLPGPAVFAIGFINYEFYRDIFGGRHFFGPMILICFIAGFVTVFFQRRFYFPMLAKAAGQVVAGSLSKEIP
jgi:hypothetical protein